MRNATRAFVVAFLGFLSAVAIGAAAVLTAAVTLAATTALIVPGTGTPKAEDVADYMPHAYNPYIFASTPGLDPECTAPTCSLVGVDYPASFWPLVFIPRWCVSGRCEKWNVSVGDGVQQLEALLPGALANSDKVVLFGYSQGARVVSIEKENLRNNPDKDKLEIVLIGNISRPNGGLWSRLSFLPTIPILDVSFGKPTPTDVGIKTTDISFEYDGVSDFPVYPLNLLAVANAIAGFQYVHGYYLVPNGNGPTDQLPWGYTPEEIQAFIEDPNNPTKGDTTYVTIPARSLPILQPFIDFGNATGTSAIVNPILELIQPALKVLIDTGYDRTANPGDPMTFRLIPRVNPIKLAVDLVGAVFQGIHDAFDGVPIVPTVTPAPSTTSTTTSTLATSTFATSTFAMQRSTPDADASRVQQNVDNVSGKLGVDDVGGKPADDNIGAKPADDNIGATPDDDNTGRRNTTNTVTDPFSIRRTNDPTNAVTGSAPRAQHQLKLRDLFNVTPFGRPALPGASKPGNLVVPGATSPGLGDPGTGDTTPGVATDTTPGSDQQQSGTSAATDSQPAAA